GVDLFVELVDDLRRRVFGRTHASGAARATASVPILLAALSEPLRQPWTYETGGDVASASRREWHNDAHRSRGIGLRPSEARRGRQRGSTRGQMQKISTGKFHRAGSRDYLAKPNGRDNTTPLILRKTFSRMPMRRRSAIRTPIQQVSPRRAKPELGNTDRE